MLARAQPLRQTPACTGLTVKLHKVVLRRLPHRLLRLGLDEQPRSDRLALVQLENHHQSRRHKRQDNGETPVGPTPIRLVELLRNLRTGIRTDDPWRRGEGEGETSVAESRRVDSDDVYGEDDTDETDGIEALSSGTIMHTIPLPRLTCAAQYV